LQYLSHLTPCLLAAAKHLLHYLAGTVKLCLCFGPSSSTGKLYSFSDADWATNPEERI
jgi:hypothetical protein